MAQVSVVIPVHNREHMIGRALASVLGQTLADIEVLVVDDCSTDATLDVVHSLGDPRVRTITLEHNLGPGGARNAGVDAATSDYIAFQDSDDRWFPEKLEMQMSLLRDRPDADGCYRGAVYFSPEQSYYIPRHGTIEQLDGDLSREVLRSNPMSPQTMLLRRTALLDSGGFDPALRRDEDWDLVIRLATEIQFCFVPDPLALIYRTPGSVSSGRLGAAQSRARLVARHLSRFEQHPDLHAMQHRIIAGMFAGAGAPDEASRHLRRSWKIERNPRTLVQFGRSIGAAGRGLIDRKRRAAP